MKLQYMAAHASIVLIRNWRHSLQARFGEAFISTCREVGLAGTIALGSNSWVPVRATPYAEIHHYANPNMRTSAAIAAPYTIARRIV
jgi:hypothetical protein